MDKYTLQLMITRRCPLQCPFCYVEHSESDMSDAVVRGTLSFIEGIVSSGSFLNLNITGGEPLLRQDLLRVIASRAARICVAKHCNLRLYVNTSAYLSASTPLLLEMNSINANNVGSSWFEVSLDGPPQLHNKYRVAGRGMGTYNIAYQNARHMLRYVPVMLRTLVYPEATDRFFEFADWYCDALNDGFWIANVGTAIGSYFAYDRNFWRSYYRFVKTLIKCVAEMYANSRFVLWRALAEDALFLKSRRSEISAGDPLPCGAGRTRFLVDCDGSLYYCTLFREIDPKGGYLGSVFSNISLSGLKYPCPLASYCHSEKDVDDSAKVFADVIGYAKRIFGNELWEEYLRDASRWV